MVLNKDNAIWMTAKLLLWSIMLFAFTDNTAVAGKISISSIDNTGYPVVKAKIFPLDDAGNRYSSINLEDFQLFENDSLKQLVSVECPTVKDPAILSSVLALDVSTSMDAGRIDLARQGVLEWISLFPNNGTECAITSFNSDSYILQDFTSDKPKLNSSLDNIKAWGGTNYNAAFLARNTGVIPLLEPMEQQKVIVLLSDGESEGDEEMIVSRANASNIKIFCVIIGMKAPDILKRIASRTGGMCFDNVSSVLQIRDIYRTILMLSLEIEPCEITWKSSICSEKADVSLFADFAALGTKSAYIVPSHLRPALVFNPSNFIEFGKIPKNDTVDKKITVTAKNGDMNVEKIEEPYKHYSIIDFGGSSPPFVLRKDSTRVFTIRYIPKDTMFFVGEFNFSGAFCNVFTLTASGGTADSIGTISQLRIINPNGGEKFRINSKTDIAWGGVAPSDSILITYNLNASEWDTISRNAVQFNHNWLVPDRQGKGFLLKILNYTKYDDYTKVSKIKLENEKISALDISRDGKLALTVGSYLRAITYPTGTLIRYIANEQASTSSLEWDPSSTYIARVGKYNNIVAWNYLIDDDVHGFSIDAKPIVAARWSRNGVYLAGAASDGNFAMWNFPDKSPVSLFKANGTGITDFDIYADASAAVIASTSGALKIYNTSTGAELMLIDNFSSKINSVALNSSDNYLLVGLQDGHFELWDIDFGDMFFTRSDLPAPVRKVRFSNDNKHFAVLSGKQVIIYSLAPATEIYRYSQNSDINDFAWTYAGDEIIIGFSNGEIHSFKPTDLPFTPRLIQQDLSDGFWTIVAPDFKLKNLDFQTVTTNSAKDTLLSNAVLNQAELSFKIDSITITGADKNAFQVISNYKQIDIATNQYLPIEFRVLSSSLGVKTAVMNLYSHGRLFKANLSAEVVKPSITMTNNLYDFGKVNLDYSLIISKNLLKNNTNAKIIIDSAIITGAGRQSFNIDGEKLLSIEPQTEISTAVIFKPLEYGKTSAFIEFYFDHPSSPLRLTLFGEGTAPEYELPDSLNFEALLCEGKEMQINIPIHNTGNGYLKIKDVVLKPDNNDITFEFDKSNIAVGESGNISVIFIPTVFQSNNYKIEIITNTTRFGSTGGEIDLYAFADTNSIDLSADVLLFNPKNENEEAFGEIAITNRGKDSLRYEAPIDFENFELISVSPNPIAIGITAIAKFRFKGGKFDSVYVQQLAFKDHCGIDHGLVLSASVGAGNAMIQTEASIKFSVNLCDFSEVAKTVAVQNIGTIPLIIYSLELAGEGADNFRVETPSNLIIMPNSTLPISLFFLPIGKDNSNVRLIIKSNAVNAVNTETTISLLPDFEFFDFSFSADTLNFGTLRENIGKVEQVQIFNRGNIGMDWYFPIDNEFFEVTSIHPKRTEPNGSSIISVRFKGGISGNIYESYFDMIDSCGTAYRFFVSAAVSGYADAALSIDNAHAAPGETITIPLRLSRIEQTALDRIDEIKTQIQFNSSLLYPTGNTPMGRIERGLRVIDLAFDPKILADDIASSLTFIALLGDSIETSLTIRNSIAISSVPVVIEENSGVFMLDSVCKIGGLRLISSTGILELLQSFPNPADEAATIKFGTIEEGVHRLTMFNTIGQKLEVLFDKFILPGQYEYILNTKHYPSGSYIYLLETPSERLTKKLDILR